MSSGDREALFCSGITSGSVGRKVRASIFNFISECNQQIWKVRNEIIFENVAIDRTGKLRALISLVCNRFIKIFNSTGAGEVACGSSLSSGESLSKTYQLYTRKPPTG